MVPVGFPREGIQEQLETCSQLNGEVWFEVEIWVSSAQRWCPMLWARMPKPGAVWSPRECCLIDITISPGPGHWSSRQQLSVQKWELMSSDSVSACHGPRALLCSGGRMQCWISEDLGENLMALLPALWPWKTYTGSCTSRFSPVKGEK